MTYRDLTLTALRIYAALKGESFKVPPRVRIEKKRRLRFPVIRLRSHR